MILLLGGSGYIGSALANCMQRREVEFRNVCRGECNYCVAEQLDDLIRQVRGCESFPLRGIRNGVGVDFDACWR